MAQCGASVTPDFRETASNSSIVDCRKLGGKGFIPIDIETLPT
jgi:hypothetical protein